MGSFVTAITSLTHDGSDWNSRPATRNSFQPATKSAFVRKKRKKTRSKNKLRWLQHKKWTKCNRRHQSHVMKHVAKHRRKPKKKYILSPDERYIKEYGKNWRKKRKPEYDRHNLHKSELSASLNYCPDCGEAVCRTVDGDEVSVSRFCWSCGHRLHAA